MSIWLFRAGKNGEYEEKFLTDNRIYLTWQNLNINLKNYKDRSLHLQKLQELYSTEKLNTIKNWETQIYPIAHRMNIGDWVVLPSKRTSTIHIGQILGDYTYNEIKAKGFTAITASKERMVERTCWHPVEKWALVLRKSVCR